MEDIDKKEGYIFLNGEWKEWKDANIHFLTHGLHYGTAVFEGERAYNGKVFKMKEHQDRLIRSAKALDMDCPYSSEEMSNIIMECLDKNNLTNAYIRPLLWRGSESMGIYCRDNKVNFAVAAWNWPSYFGDVMEKGISLCYTKWKRPAPDTFPVTSKVSGNYEIGVLTKHEAKDRGFDDGIMLSYNGYIAECSGMNIFFVMSDNTIITPAEGCILNGITRQTIISIAKDKGYHVIEKDIMPEEIESAKEVFVTGTAAEITPVGKIEDTVYKVGDITKELRSAYVDMVN